MTMIPLLKAWGFVSSPIGRALGVGLIAIVALGYAYMKGAESGRADSQEAALRAQIETLREDLRITMRAAEQAAAQEAAAEAREANLNERLKTYESALAVPPADSGFTADDVRGLRELTR